MRTLALTIFVLLSFGSRAHAADDAAPAPSMTLEAVYTAELWDRAGADVRSRNDYLDNLDLTAALDGEALLGVKGLRLFAYALYNNGHVLNDDEVGSVQGVSNIESVRALRLYEAWAEQSIGPLASVRVGLYDLNSEFDSIESAALFINPSHGIGADFAQSGENGPSIFPATSLAVRLQAQLGRWQARVAILDAVPGDPAHPDNTTVRLRSEEGFLYAAEVNYSPNDHMRTGFGFWQYSEAFDDLSQVDEAGEPIARTNNQGAYAFADTGPLELANEHGFLNVFTRTGWANDDMNPVTRYVGAGVAWSGFVADRADRIGLSVAHATMGDGWRRAMAAEGIATRGAETILELTVRIPVGGLVAIQPDVQYVRHPGAMANRNSMWAYGVRLEIGVSYER